MASFSPSSPPSRGDGHAGPVPALLRRRQHSPLGPEPTVLVIGYPALDAVQIVERLLATDARTIACVVHRERWRRATRLHQRARDTGRLRLFEGDAAAPGLGLPHTAWRILDTTDEIYAVASTRTFAAGHIQDVADECPRLRELHRVAQSDGRDARSSRRVMQRLRERGPASIRRAFRRLASGTAALPVVAPIVRAIGPWRNLLDFGVETALSWDDLERDLWPGVRRAA